MERKPPLAAGQLLRLPISSLGSQGEGVGAYQGFKVFVPLALRGEEVLCRIQLVKKNYALGRLEEVVTASPERVEPPCPVYGRCGGCTLQHLSYPGQLAEKRLQVEAALARIGHLQAEVEPTLGCDQPWHYRNKMQFPAAWQGEGRLALGCYRQGSHQVVDTAACLIAQQGNNQVLEAVRQWMTAYRISTYDEATGRGLVRHVMARCGAGRPGEEPVLAVLVTAAARLPRAQELVAALQAGVPGLVGVVQNINPRPGNVILGRDYRLLSGQAWLTERLGLLRFQVSPASFFQVNREQAERLYATVKAYAALEPGEVALDLYCGTGTIALYLAQGGAQVYGIEVVAAAVEDARANAQANGCTTVRFSCGDAAQELPRLLEAGLRPQVAVLDPPRAGCAASVLAAVAGARPRRIVYVSCNSATLARDGAYLAEQGYRLERVQPLDMFPQTSNVETVALLTRAGA